MGEVWARWQANSYLEGTIPPNSPIRVVRWKYISLYTRLGCIGGHTSA